ncbi:hypothetical protein TRIUR3_16069 [Triticum urartu]|uniref:Alpha/beta hydrolase fold-3 domain-containing protein n=1 Tax=Triticum urartu TaxID=4572 RepID=M7Z9J0_TRIUA|nr:hypothetical protein TRIUR3_16069 [Triticum urartu]
MQASKSSPANQNHGRNISVDMYPFIRKYQDGSIERFLRSPFVPASSDQARNRGVATRDVVVDKATGVSVRLFLPCGAAETAGRNRLPLVIYVHGGSFCTESAFGRTYHRYATSLAASCGALGRRREVTVVESEGEEHGFHLYSPLRATSKRLMGSLVEFINQQPNSSPANPMVLGVPTTPCKDVFGYGMAMKAWCTRSSMPRNTATSLKIGRVGPSNTRYRLISGRLLMTAGNAHHKDPLSAAVPWTCVINNFF